MKKLVSIIILFTITLGIANFALAVDEYYFDLQYTGTVIKDEVKNANVLLVGNNGTLYPKVRIKVDVNGPAKPKIMATDSNNVEHDIAEIGYWGPPDGFAVQGYFTNTTPIKATFPEEGQYVITLSLINMTDNSVIITKTFDINVISNQQDVIENEIIENEIIENEIIENNTNIEELPKTGTSIWEYLTCFAIVGIILVIVGMYIKLRK